MLHGSGQPCFVVAGTDSKIILTQKDVREFQLAKSAVYTTVKLLLREISAAPEDVSRIFISGGFGNYIDLANAVKIKLLPEIPFSKYKFLGNGSLGGGQMVLLNKTCRRTISEFPARCRSVELAAKKGFQESFTNNLHF